MKKTYLIGNWKMQLSGVQGIELAKEVVRLWGAQGAANPDVVVAICPSHVSLDAIHQVVNGTSVCMGAQDVFWEEKGQYTGEISPGTLKELGCEFCIVGHSERRGFLGETDEMVRRKAAALLKQNIHPVICVGETLEERRAGKRDGVVINQVKEALKDIRPYGTQRIIVAYEPRWIIGTGQAVAPDDAASMHQLIRETLNDMLPADIIQSQLSVIYGGSVDPSNLAGFLAMDVIDGVLVGNCSLRPKDFVKLAEIAADLAKNRKE
jgi:triosephosphate isomerase (TIM)